MTEVLPELTEQSLLQFLYVCPIGLVEFSDAGSIIHVNPKAVALLSLCLGQQPFANVFDALSLVWPELFEVIAKSAGTQGALVQGHRISSATGAIESGTGIPNRTVLSINVVRVGPNQNMLTLTDVSEADLADEILRSSENRFRLLFDQAIDGIILLSSEGHFVDVNPAACELLGYDKTEFLTLNLADLLSGDELVRGLTLTNSLGYSSNDRGLWTLRRKDRSHFIADAAVRRRSDGLLQGVVRDVTELRTAQALVEQHQRIAMQQQRLRETLIMTAPVGIALFDANFVCLEINDVMARYNGVSPEETIGRTPADYLPSLWPTLEPTFRRALLGTVHNVEISGYTPARPLVRRWWLSSFNQIPLPENEQGFALITIDITERKQAELALLEQQNQLWSVFTSIDEGFCLCEVIFDDEDRPVNWRYLAVNPQFEEMSGISDPVGKTILELVPDFELEWIVKFGNLSTNGGVLRFEQGSQALDRWFDVFATSVGIPGRFAVVFKDQTQKRKADAAIVQQAQFNAFRAEFTDSLLGLNERTQLESLAAEMLGRFLQADRVNYIEVDDELDLGIVRNEYLKDSNAQPMMGRAILNDFGPEILADISVGRLVLVKDVLTDDRLNGPGRQTFREIGARSFLVAPLARIGRTEGAFVVQFVDGHFWSDQEVALVDEVAQRTLAAVDQMLATIQLVRKQARSDAVARVLVELELLGTIEEQAQSIIEMLFADYATFEVPGAVEPVIALAHVDPEMLPVLEKLRATRAVDPNGALSVFRAAEGEVQMLAKVTKSVIEEYAPLKETQDLLFDLNPRSYLAVPIELGGSERGALMVGITRPDRELYDADDLEFLRNSALRFGVLIAATRLRREEHEISARLQRALRPDKLIWVPEFDITARYHAVSSFMEVGGDWYDSFRWSTGEIALMVGDVVGHNLESAAAMGRLRAGVAAVAPTLPPSPAALLEALHQCAQGPGGSPFVTATCIVIDSTTGILKYSSAGHPPTLILSPSGTMTRLDDAQAPPLTPMQSNHRPERVVQLEPGSLVFMYSDGLIERRRERIDVGIARLEAALRSTWGERSEAVADIVLKAMGATSNTEDDVVVVCVRFTPTTAKFEAVIPAKPAELSGLRTKVRAWLHEHQVSKATLNDVLLAVGEACANSVEHAYQNQPNRIVAVELTLHDGHLVATIEDYGTWGASTRRKGEGGRGTNIMSTLSSHYERKTSSAGTVVTMSLLTPHQMKVFQA